jgi:hypothetical protein
MKALSISNFALNIVQFEALSIVVALFSLWEEVTGGVLRVQKESKPVLEHFSVSEFQRTDPFLVNLGESNLK